MISFDIVYEQFLSVSSNDFGDLTNEEIKEELYNLTVLSIPRFRFPRISLKYKTFDNSEMPDGKGGTYFLEDVTQKEITVIVEYMLSSSTQKQLTAASEENSYYQDANLKLPSVTGRVTQLNRANENQMKKAKRTEEDYYSTRNDSPTLGEIWGT